MQIAASERVGPPRSLPFSMSRAGDVALFLFWTAQGLSSTRRAFLAAGQQDWLAAAHVSIVAAILFLTATLFLLRGPAVARGGGLAPKLVAIVGTWAIIPLTALPLTWRPDWLLAGVTGGLIATYVFVFWALFTLRRSLSIFPEARELIQHGPYGLVRHPLYAAHIASYTLIALPRLGVAALAIAAIGIAAEVLRARNEERVLGDAFANYAAYASVTPRFMPRLGFRDLRRLQS